MNKTVIVAVLVFGLLVWGVASLGQAYGKSADNVVSASTPGFKEFNVVMLNNQYQPSRLQVNLGDTVTINLENRDSVAHGVDLPEFGASVPGGHVRPGESAQLSFVANKITVSDAATCGGPSPTDKTDDHGEELIIEVT